jgi:hypothetical protein
MNWLLTNSGIGANIYVNWSVLQTCLHGENTMQSDPVNDITKRTQRYWYVDGIWEIGFGLVNTLLGSFYLLTARLDWKGPLSSLLVVLQMGVLIGLFMTIHKVVTFLKERITYPRTGYVAYRKPALSTRLKKALLTALLAAGIAALVGGLAAVRLTANRMPLVISVILAGTLIFLGYRFSLVRLYIIAALTIVWGYTVSLYPLSDLSSTGAFFAGFGLLILFSGAVTLFFYLRRTHPATEDLLDAPLPENYQDER